MISEEYSEKAGMPLLDPVSGMAHRREKTGHVLIHFFHVLSVLPTAEKGRVKPYA